MKVTTIRDIGWEVGRMFHAGFAWELSKTLVENRVERSGRRFLSSGDRGRIAARDERERSNRIFEQALSLAGASALLALVSFGVGGSCSWRSPRSRSRSG